MTLDLTEVSSSLEYFVICTASAGLQLNAVQENIREIGGRPTQVVMHNDAVVQGLSELPFTRDVPKWAVLTIGTGLGNARFTNRGTEDEI